MIWQCEDRRCPGVLAGPLHPDLCPACRAAFARAGIATSGEQLELELRRAA
jgi:hypothetical protein